MKETPVDYIVFTDASLKSSRITKREYCGYAVVLLNTATKEYTEFSGELGGMTSMYGEAFAVFKGMQKLVQITADEYDEKSLQVLLVSDSKNVVETLNLYIPFLWDTSDPKYWRKVDGTRVKNQNLFRRILGIIQKHPEIKFRITHINSHKNTITEWEKAQTRLSQYNIWVNKTTAQLFMEMNAKADELAQEVTKQMREKEEREGKFMRLKWRPTAL